MKTITTSDLKLAISNGKAVQLQQFTSGDGNLYTNPEKGNLIFVRNILGRFFAIAKYV